MPGVDETERPRRRSRLKWSLRGMAPLRVTGMGSSATTGKAKKPQLPGKTRTDVVAGTNILKAGGEDVKLLPDEAYPDWLWDIGKPQPSLEDLREVVKDGEGLFELSGAERVRYLRLERREDIRAANKKKSK